jgi:hypothetical protein
VEKVLNILHLSDLHFDSDHLGQNDPIFANLLQNLKEIFFVPGNHDLRDPVAPGESYLALQRSIKDGTSPLDKQNEDGVNLLSKPFFEFSKFPKNYPL